MDHSIISKINTKTPLQELDSSTAINILRYIIALNALFTNGFLLYLFIR
jgi:hypothetical protein